ncbi:unnamed protein product [Brassicogethes aeneus]|uniref:Protein-lysine N-methyltransferase MELIAE_LOCUS1067 n=1 Tax=Brassicogethes aeneus TaxID=1431903 RepID=A0A9P0AQC4_BRAAE|nr:unnamed protein product [Brassicogethes aeneus]
MHEMDSFGLYPASLGKILFIEQPQFLRFLYVNQAISSKNFVTSFWKSLQRYLEMEELGECELGTHKYWEIRYNNELKEFKNNGDPGEIWFGEDIVDRILRWFGKNLDKIGKNSKILDVGCGNGMLLIDMSNEGFTNLYGVDYSLQAIELAKSIADKHTKNINYSVCDILSGLNDIFFIIHDKGTYDAISLSKNSFNNRNKYIENVFECLEDNGYLFITSCNWTQSELEQHFINKFILFEVIPTPQFKFGGKIGNVVTSVVFKKK